MFCAFHIRRMHILCQNWLLKIYIITISHLRDLWETFFLGKWNFFRIKRNKLWLWLAEQVLWTKELVILGRRKNLKKFYHSLQFFRRYLPILESQKLYIQNLKSIQCNSEQMRVKISCSVWKIPQAFYKRSMSTYKTDRNLCVLGCSYALINLLIQI